MNLESAKSRCASADRTFTVGALAYVDTLETPHPRTLPESVGAPTAQSGSIPERGLCAHFRASFGNPGTKEANYVV